MKLTYAVVFEQTPNTYSAYSPELPGCIGTAATLKGAQEIMREAINIYIESAIEKGEPLPIPRMSAQDALAFHNNALSEYASSTFATAQTAISTTVLMIGVDIAAPVAASQVTEIGRQESTTSSEPEIYVTPEIEEYGETGKGRQLVKTILRTLVAWIALVSLWIADGLIWIMIRFFQGRRIRPTQRIAWPKGLKEELMRRQKNTCVYCGNRRTARTLDIDHIVPVVRGGSNDKSNLQVICSPCNQRKGLQTDEEFRARYSRLVPKRRLTPPRRRISQDEFKALTQRTSQSDTVQEFRRTRFISKRERVAMGCLALAAIVFFVGILALSSIGLEGALALLPSTVLGLAAGIGVGIRAYVTGAMIEDDS